MRELTVSWVPLARIRLWTICAVLASALAAQESFNIIVPMESASSIVPSTSTEAPTKLTTTPTMPSPMPDKTTLEKPKPVTHGTHYRGSNAPYLSDESVLHYSVTFFPSTMITCYIVFLMQM